MWEEYEEKRADKPYLWIVFFLLLLLLSSIFFLRPSVGTIPTATMPVTKNAPVTTNIGTIPSSGIPVYMAEATTGVWGVYRDADKVHISFFNALGDEQWAESIGVSAEPLIASKGNYFAIASLRRSQIALYHGKQQLVHVTDVPGEIETISVNEMGEVLVTLTTPETDPLLIRTHVALFSSLGQQIWTKSVDNMLPVACSQSADGTRHVVLGINMQSKPQGEVVTYGRSGELIFSSKLTDRPVDLTVRDDGERIVVATATQIEAFDKEGAVLWKHDVSGELIYLAYSGRGAQLAYLATRKSMLNFKQQFVIVAVADSGKLSWQYRSNESVVVLGTASLNTNIIIGTGKRANLYGSDGRAQWSVNHNWGDKYLAATLDGRHFVILTPQGKVLQVREN